MSKKFFKKEVFSKGKRKTRGKLKKKKCKKKMKKHTIVKLIINFNKIKGIEVKRTKCQGVKSKKVRKIQRSKAKSLKVKSVCVKRP